MWMEVRDNNVEHKKPRTKEHALRNSIYMKFTDANSPIMMQARRAEGGETRKEVHGNLRGEEITLCPAF